MRETLGLALAAAAFSAIPTIASAQVVNGGFEAPVISNPCCNTVPPDALPGWTVDTGDINVVNGTYAGPASPGPNLAYEGLQYLDLVGQSGSGSISQSIATVAGQVYQLTFAYSNNIFGGAAAAAATVSIGSLLAPIAHSTATTTNLNWTVFTGTFVGTGSDTLNFTSVLDSQNGSIFLDAVSIAAVPEASTWLMMIFGFGLAGAAIRRRKRTLAIA